MIQLKSPADWVIQENIDTRTRGFFSALLLDTPTTERELRKWFRTFPESLYRLAVAGLEIKVESFVHSMMVSDLELCTHLCNPALLDMDAATRLARLLLVLEPRLDVRLAQASVRWASRTDDAKPLRRSLDLLEAIESGPRINSFLVQLLKCGNGAVRSKVVGILVRSSANETNIREWLRDPDPRFRANILESLVASHADKELARQLLMDHLNDSHWRVAANAAVGLDALGLGEMAVARLIEMASSEDPMVRCSGAWGMGRIKNASAPEVLHRLRKDPDERVRWNALRGLVRLNKAGAKQTQSALPAVPAPDPVEELVAAE